VFLRVVAVCSLVVTFAGLAACGDKDCASIQDSDKRDWCYYERAADAAAEDRGADAIGELAHIRSPMVRAAAVDKIITEAPEGLTAADAENLCRNLPEPQSRACFQTWNRPHLWEK